MTVVQHLAQLWGAPIDLVEEAWEKYASLPDLYRFGIARAMVKKAMSK